ncbi:Mammalian cell entry related domain protein [Nocardia nepalensis]|uniref:Mammalian cell entry related domain protein n=1 Tax=Nocardia nepalensis TaxID=3375448 RepID=UPI003B673C07
MLLRGTEQDETRKLALIGLAGILCMVLVGGLVVMLRPGRSGTEGTIDLGIEVPYVGQGVTEGTGLMLHGLPVGAVETVSRRTGGGVLLGISLRANAIEGLTDSFDIDYRPVNYFGITGVNIVPGAGGNPLRYGETLSKAPLGNFTMQALLSSVGGVSGGVLTEKFISVIDRATRYTDGLTPFVRVLLQAANALTRVQIVPTETLLENAAGLSASFPSFLHGTLDGSNKLIGTKLSTVTDAYFTDVVTATLDLFANQLFGAVGTLLRSHGEELTPLTGILGVAADTAAVLATRADAGPESHELLQRLRTLFTAADGRPGATVHIVVDRLPAFAGPLAILGAAAQEGQR